MNRPRGYTSSVKNGLPVGYRFQSSDTLNLGSEFFAMGHSVGVGDEPRILPPLRVI